MTDLTIKIFQGLREDVQELRSDMNVGFTSVRSDMNAGFASVRGEMKGLRDELHTELGEIRRSVGAIAAFKERDTVLLADDLDGIRRRLVVCEERLGIEQP